MSGVFRWARRVLEKSGLFRLNPKEMGYIGGNVVRRIDADDPRRIINIVVREDGTFQIREELALSTGGWTPSRISGFYQSLDLAEQSVGGYLPFDYGGMTVNERLSVAGLLKEFEVVSKARNRAEMIKLLARVGITEGIDSVVDAALSRL